MRVLGIIARIVAQELKALQPVDFLACLEDEERAQLGAVVCHRHLGVGRGRGRGGAHILATDLTLEAVHSACCGLVDGEVCRLEYVVVLRNLIVVKSIVQRRGGIFTGIVNHALRNAVQRCHIELGDVLPHLAAEISLGLSNGGFQRIDAVGADIGLYNPVARHVATLISVHIGIGSRRI